MREHRVNSLDNFICGWYIDESVCDDVINYYKNSDKVTGESSTGINLSVKNSTDCSLLESETSKKYLIELQKCLDEYTKKYKYSNAGSPWTMIQTANIQHYKQNGAYYAWHCERHTYEHPYVSRHLVFITYLNDVTDDGETEFYHQKIKIKPEKGLTLIFGSDWTFTHRGIPSKSQEKYIVTGWFNYVDRR